MDYYEKLGKPKYILAPMVDGSELPWRLFARELGAELCFTPMIHSKNFLISSQKDGIITQRVRMMHPKDKPLIAQLCGNDPEYVRGVVSLLSEQQFDGVDLNLGCPQNIAKKGHYGAFLQEDWDLIEKLLIEMNQHLPVSCKIRLQSTMEKSFDYVNTLMPHISLLTIHARLREQKGGQTGFADWEKLTELRESASKLPVFGNGNILYYKDCQKMLKETGVDGVMVAEGHLYHPCVFWPGKNQTKIPNWERLLPKEIQSRLDTEKFPLLIEHAPVQILVFRFLEICKELMENPQFYELRKAKTIQVDNLEMEEEETYFSGEQKSNDLPQEQIEETKADDKRLIRFGCIKGHLFKLLHHILGFVPEYRRKIHLSKSLDEIEQILTDLFNELNPKIIDVWDNQPQGKLWQKWLSEETLETNPKVWGSFRLLPFWVSQPLIRGVSTRTNLTELDTLNRKKVLQDDIINRNERKNNKRQRTDSSFQPKIKYEKCLGECGGVAGKGCDFQKCLKCCKTRHAESIRLQEEARCSLSKHQVSKPAESSINR